MKTPKAPTFGISIELQADEEIYNFERSLVVAHILNALKADKDDGFIDSIYSWPICDGALNRVGDMLRGSAAVVGNGVVHTDCDAQGIIEACALPERFKHSSKTIPMVFFKLVSNLNHADQIAKVPETKGLVQSDLAVAVHRVTDCSRVCQKELYLDITHVKIESWIGATPALCLSLSSLSLKDLKLLSQRPSDGTTQFRHQWRMDYPIPDDCLQPNLDKLIDHLMPSSPAVP